MVKIPNFLSKKSSSFNSGADGVKEKQEFIHTYKNWLHHEMTKELAEWAEHQLNELVEKEESKSDFLTLFQSGYSDAHSKGQRVMLRKIIKQLK